MPVSQYYPALTSLVPSDRIPEPIKSLVDAITSKLFYKSYYAEKSVYGDTAYHHLVLVFNKMGLNLFGGDDGFEIIFNPSEAGDITELPISVYYSLPAVKYIRRIQLQEISTVEDYLDAVLEIFNLSKADMIAEAIEAFLGGTSDPLQEFVDAFNSNPDYGSYTLTMPDLSGETADESTGIASILEQFRAQNLDVKLYLLETYLEDADIAQGVENLSKLFKKWLGEFNLQTIIDLFIPKFAVTITTLEVALAFPRKWLQPVNTSTGEVINDDSKSMLTYDVGSVSYNSESGFEFAGADSFSLTPSMIGNTGLILELEGVKFDFRTDRNIPEADADGRPADFRGVFLETIGITLPKKWFKDDLNPNTTLRIAGNNILVGTGGLSGTILLEAITPGTTDRYWKTIGSTDGFRIGFESFDISFKQNKVVSSNIKGALEIKKFKYPSGPNAGQTVMIDIEGHLHDDGDFNLTASTQPPYPIALEDVFTYNIKSLELGKEDDDFYIGTSGSIQFEGMLKDVLHLGAIDIDRLRIYSDGRFELEGGSIHLTEPIVLPLGPVEITVTAIHYGSHQKEVGGEMRKFNYFGFDGGVSVDPLGVEIRGDGVKYYYCVDDLPNKPDSYLHIQTLYLDLTIPSKTPVAIINGWLSIPEPGQSKEYAGGIKLKLPKAKISGSADMKLMPKYPAFIIDAEIEFPAPIPLGTFALYGFRGLIGYRYVAEKEAIGLVSGVNTWYEYYKAPPRGIHVRKFNGPDKTKQSGTPFSIGAGASLGTSFDNGTVLNIKAMVLLSIPSLFMIDGRAAIISARLGLDDSGDPPFFAFVALGDNSLEFGFGADFKIPKSSGAILSLYADVQAGFFFNDSSKWYVNLGTDVNPITARVVTLITLKSYLMLSAKGIAAGARGEFDFKRTYGIIRVHAWAFIEVGGKISFEKPQFGAYLQAEVGADIDIKFISLYFCVGIVFGVEAPKPFKIYGKFYYTVRIKILWVFKFSFSGWLEVVWEFNSEVNVDPINPLINSSNVSNLEALTDMVKGVNMLSAEKFDLKYLGSGALPTTWQPGVLENIIPLDTFIDIKTEKGFLPDAVGNLIGGVNNPPARYTDLVPPDKIVKGKTLRQVKHSYSIENLVLKFWDGAPDGSSGSWQDYHPYHALYPNSNGALDGLKIGQFQKADGQYNTIRLLATTPFSYTDQGEPGWHIPEQYGINASTLFCQGEEKETRCANFLEKQLGQRYYCYDINQMFFSNQAGFLLIDRLFDEDYTFITDEANAFGFAQSLAFNDHNKMLIQLPQPSVEITLRISNSGQGVRLKFYAPLFDPNSSFVPYGNPDPNAADPTAPYIVTLTQADLANPYQYQQPENWHAVAQIVIEPLWSPLLSQQIAAITEQIAIINDLNNQISLEMIEGEIQSTEALEQQLHELACSGGGMNEDHFVYDIKRKKYKDITSGANENWFDAWDYANDSKIVANNAGFNYLSDNTEVVVMTDYPIYQVTVNPVDYGNGPVMPVYTVVYDGNKALIQFSNLYDYLQGKYFVDIEVAAFAEGEGCGDSDEKLCALYDTLLEIFNNCLINPEYIEGNNLAQQEVCIRNFYELLYNFAKQNPQYHLLETLDQQMNQLLVFLQSPVKDNYVKAWQAVVQILEHLAQLGKCECECNEGRTQTMLHQVCWLSLEDYQYNINIPQQDAISEDTQATLAGITDYIQPIWRPDTSYMLHFVLKDTVNDGGAAPGYYKSTYGFTTAGPIGYFHTHPNAKYGQIEVSGQVVNDALLNPDKYALTMLRQYIDYARSYPNADGNLLSAKPLFYDDGPRTRISLYFAKAYANQFFKNWQPYFNRPEINGRIKIVIKDPREDETIDNPPYLDFDPADTVYTNIPQTVEEWVSDDDPQIPFVISQYMNLYNASQCTGSVEIIKPASEFMQVFPKNLKPNKLYTAVVNNLYDLSKDGEFDSVADVDAERPSETREVHKFVFRTSRYRNFEGQVNSFTIEKEVGGVLTTSQSVFHAAKLFTVEEIQSAYNAMTGAPLTISNPDALANLEHNYQHLYDRIIEGVLGLTPLDAAISTEVNLVRNLSDNKVVALIVRNPEPFNHPKIPLSEMADALKVFTAGVENTDYSVLFSKDYAAAIIMHSSLEITEDVDLQFTYKLWNGSIYAPEASVTINVPVLNN